MLLHFGGSFLDVYFSEGMLLSDRGDVASRPHLTSHYRPASAGTQSAMRVPCYKNRGKIGESVQLPCNLANSPFLLVASSLAPRSSSLNRGGGEASKRGDDGAGPGCDQPDSPCKELGDGAAAVVPLCYGDGTGQSQ